MGQSCTAISGCDVAASRTCCDKTEQNFVTRQRTLDAVNEEKFPMACMTVRTFLKLDIFPSYGELKKRGLLVSPGTGLKVHFISHEWLSTKHPDPSSVQLRRLQKVFRQILAGDGADLFNEDDWRTFSQGVSAFWTSQLSDGEGSAQVDKVNLMSFAQHVEEGVVWLDFSSIPQMIDVQDADKTELLQHEMKQALAVQTIPYYLERSNYFWVLTPDAVHEHSKDICGFASWRGRGWCRLEEWANFLSKRCLMPLVVTDAPKISTYSMFSFMLDNLSKPERAPCMGEFSCCAKDHTYGEGSLARVLPCDKKGIVQVLNVMFNAKIKHQLPVAPGMCYVLCGLEHVVYAGAEHFSHLLHPSDMMAIEGETVEHFAARVGFSSVDDKMSVFRARCTWTCRDFAGPCHGAEIIGSSMPRNVVVQEHSATKCF